jgi:NAD(P)-dependent dehydrogenase (short-subunit alcohol dehydrogenase family)
MELERYGVRCNAIAPAARTRLTMTVPGAEEMLNTGGGGDFDEHDPANVSPFVAYLATEDCPIKGSVFFVAGSEVHLFQPWSIVDKITTDGRWTVPGLQKEAARFADVTFDLGKPY